MNSAYRIENGERQDIEQLCYLGLKAAFGGSRSRRSLRALARSCTNRKFRFMREWGMSNTLPTVRLEGDSYLRAACQLGKGVIVCTPHVGPSKRIALELTDQNFHVSMPLDQANFEQECSQYASWAKRYPGSVSCPMQYINVESPAATWEMTRSLRAERVLFIWLDGNAGLESVEQARTTVIVSFCGLKLQVRKGLAFLSAYTGAPIIPAVARYTRRGGHVIRFEAPLEHIRGEPIDDYCLRVMQHLFSILETQVNRDPACWEEWCHVHRWQARSRQTIDLTLLQDCDPESILRLTLALDHDSVEVIKMSMGSVMTSTRSGAALLLTESMHAIAGSLNGRNTIGDLLCRLASKYDERLLLKALYTLCANGFVVRLD